MLVNQSPHQLDLLQWFMGDDRGGQRLLGQPQPPRRSRSTTPPWPMIRFKNGGLGSIVTSVSQKPGLLHQGPRPRVERGVGRRRDRPRARPSSPACPAIAEPPLNDLWTIPGEEHLLAEFQAEDRARFAADRRHRRTTTPCRSGDFLRAVLDGRPPLVTGEDGRAVVAMFTAIYRSHRERRPIAFPLAAEDRRRRP